MGRRDIRDYVPNQHHQLYAQIPFMLSGSVYGNGQPWTSRFLGSPV